MKNKFAEIWQHINKKTGSKNNKFAEIQKHINKKTSNKDNGKTGDVYYKQSINIRYLILNNELFTFISSVILSFFIFILVTNKIFTNEKVKPSINKTTYRKLDLLFNSNTRRINAIIKYSKKNNFDPLLTAAIIYMESNNNALLVSRVNARGLMQVRRETGYDSARWQGKHYLAFLVKHIPQILHITEINIDLATYYIRKYKDLYHLNWEQALHAYNVGPTAFRRGKRHFYYVNRIMRFYSDWKKMNLMQIRRRYFATLISVYGLDEKIIY